jgi:hypothetical protein
MERVEPKMSERIRISGKDLGAVALPGFCPRCFWIQRRAPAGLPFQSFPGIFSSIDAYTKRVVHSWIDQHQRTPAWLDEVGPITGYREPPHHSKFSVVDSQTDILLTGAVDGVFVRPDLSHIIIDYKTARYTSAQDALFPIYKTQLNAYALIGEACGFSPVSALALVYAEPVTDQAAASHGTNQRNDGFAMGFAVRVVPVKLDLSTIPPLLGRVREILDLPEPPAGRTGCRDCLKIDGLLNLLRLSATVRR